MATLDELRLKQLLQSFEGPSGIASLSQAESPLSFRYQDELYPNQMQYQYPLRTDISPTQDYYPTNNIDPTQNFYPERNFVNAPQDFYQPRADISPTQDYYPERNFVNAPQDFYQPDLTTLRGLDMDRFQGVSDMSVIDETTNDEQDQEYINQVEKSRNPFRGIMDLFRNIPTPFNLIKKGLGSLRGFNDRLQNSNFGRSKNLMDYLDARKYGGIDARDRAAQQNMREARAIQTQVNRRGDSTSRVADRNRSSVTRSSAARSRGVGGGGYTSSDSNRESYRG